MRKLSAAFVVAIAVCAAAATTVPAFAADNGATYVALGDSAAAGPGLPPSDTSAPACQRSMVNYPKLAAKQLGVSVDDVTCSGATTAHITQSQFPGVAPQLGALSPDTKLVSIQVGANNLAITTQSGIPSSQTPRSVASAISTVLDEVSEKAPDAEVFVVGYPTYLPPNGCFPIQPITLGAANSLQSSIDQLNGVLSDQAAAHHDHYIDLRTPSKDHSMCAANGQSWIQSAIPLPGAAPYHPNAQGMEAFAKIVADDMR